MKFALILVALTAALTLIACEEVPKSLTIEGPETVTTRTGSTFTATALGGYPIVGEVTFYWYFDTDGDEFPDADEILRRRVVNPDADSKAVSTYWWKAIPSQIGERTLSVFVAFADPGTDGYTFRNEEIEVTVTT
jgi:hypothetical protein